MAVGPVDPCSLHARMTLAEVLSLSRKCFSGELERGFSQKSRLSNVFLLERLGRSEYALLAHLKKLTHKAITNGLEENT